MNFQELTTFLASFLHGPGVFTISISITLGFLISYKFTNSRQILNSMPGLFTSLVLLGIFAAICNSLGDISEDSLQVDKIITNLIPAFTSSIAGLICAFFATLFCKILYAAQDKKLEKKIKNKSPEECLLEIAKNTQIANNKLDEITRVLSNQTVRNGEYKYKLTSTISTQSSIMENFIEGFVKRMDSIFVKMHDQIEQNIKSFGEEQFQKSAVVLQELTNNLSQISKQLLDSQTTNVEQMIDNTNSELKQVSNVVTNQMNQLCSQMTNALSNIGSNQNQQLTSIIENYDNLSSRLAGQNGEFAEKMLSEMNSQYDKFQNHNVENLQQMVALKDAFNEVSTEIIHSAKQMNQEVSSELRSSLSEFLNNIQNSISDEISVLNRMIETNVINLQKSYSYISDHVANIKGNYESSAQSYIDAVNNAHRMNESQEKMLNTISSSMNSVVKTNEKVDTAIHILEERQDKIENLLAHIQEISTTITTLQKLEHQLNRIAS